MIYQDLSGPATTDHAQVLPTAIRNGDNKMSSSEAILLRSVLQDRLDEGCLTFSRQREPSDKEFQALVGLANAERRAERFKNRVERGGQIWALKKAGSLLAFEIEDTRGKVRSAVPFWPAWRYAEYVKNDIKCECADVCSLGLIEWLDNILSKELPKRRVCACLFWLPGTRSVVRSPSLVAKETIEGILWSHLGEFIILAEGDDEHYEAMRKTFFRRNIHKGPKGKLT